MNKFANPVLEEEIMQLLQPEVEKTAEEQPIVPAQPTPPSKSRNFIDKTIQAGTMAGGALASIPAALLRLRATENLKSI